MLTKVLIGTENPSKLIEIHRYFDWLGIESCSPAELGCSCHCPEDQRTPLGNAIQKATAWQQAAGIPAFAVDSGLLFLDLPEDHPDQPGTYVRRVGGKTLTDDEMLAYYQALVRKHGGQLRACWQNGVCLAEGPEQYRTFVKSREMLEESAFLLVEQPYNGRHDGWPLDSISVNIATGRYYMEMENRFDQGRFNDWDNAVITWLRSVIHEF